MTPAAETPLKTTEQLLTVPEDGMERELIRGLLREREITRRNQKHCRSEIRIGHLIEKWLETQPEPRGAVYGGEVGVNLRRNPDTSVGIDVAYFSADLVAANQDAVFMDGAPVLAVEILSASDQVQDILDKVEEYLDCGVRQVWVVEPRFQTVTVYRPDGEPAFFAASHEIDGGSALPGFRARVSEFF